MRSKDKEREKRKKREGIWIHDIKVQRMTHIRIIHTELASHSCSTKSYTAMLASHSCYYNHIPTVLKSHYCSTRITSLQYYNRFTAVLASHPCSTTISFLQYYNHIPAVLQSHPCSTRILSKSIKRNCLTSNQQKQENDGQLSQSSPSLYNQRDKE